MRMHVITQTGATPALYLKAAGGFFSWSQDQSDAILFGDKKSADVIGEIIVEATTSTPV